MGLLTTTLISASLLFSVTSLAQVNPDRIEARQNAQTARQEKREEAKAERAERIAQIRDERAQAAVERIAARFDEMNDKWVSHWTRTLDRLTGILDKIEARAGNAQEGADTSDVDSAIAEARVAIESAQAAVDTQVAKEYTLEFEDDTTLGQVMRSHVADFRNDIKTTWDEVKAAHEAVVGALTAAKGNSLQNRNLNDTE